MDVEHLRRFARRRGTNRAGPVVVHCVKRMLLANLVQFEIGWLYSVGFRDVMVVLVFEKKAKKTSKQHINIRCYDHDNDYYN